MFFLVVSSSLSKFSILDCFSLEHGRQGRLESDNSRVRSSVDLLLLSVVSEGLSLSSRSFSVLLVFHYVLNMMCELKSLKPIVMLSPLERIKLCSCRAPGSLEEP